jgi:galactokinase/mevalonate kinase-like predicted kinase
MGMPIGKQDQYAAAFGGLNKIVFSREGVTVEPIRIASDVRQALERRLAANLSTSFIDECYELALNTGAFGGKITGAGGGGFLLLYCPETNQGFGDNQYLL